MDTLPEFIDPNHAGIALAVLAAGFMMLGRAGLALAHTGFCRTRNALALLTFHLVSLAISIIAFFLVGVWIMRAASHDFTGHSAFPPAGLLFSAGDPFDSVRLLVLSLALSFTAAIPIGALAERWKSRSFVFVSVVLAGVAAPAVAGSLWPGSWFCNLVAGITGVAPMDQGGAAFIHLFAGVFAYMGIRDLGPRTGKYSMGKPRALFGHNMPMLIFGTFLMGAGWPAVTLAALPPFTSVATAAVCGLLGAAAGALSAALYMGKKFGKPDPSMISSGTLAGLVAVSGGVAALQPWAAIVLGALAGIIVSMAIIHLDGRGLDDPCGVVSIHGMGGMLGVLGVGIFSAAPQHRGLIFGHPRQVLAQMILVLFSIAAAAIAGWLTFKLSARLAGPNRVPTFMEHGGQDSHEMGLPAYPEFGAVASERSDAISADY